MIHGMNHVEIIHIEVKYSLMNTAQRTTVIWFRSYQNVYMLIDHYTILFDNELDNYNS